LPVEYVPEHGTLIHGDAELSEHA